MKYRITGEISVPPERLMRVYHDRVEQLATRLPNVARVEVIEREPQLTKMRWFAKGDIPRAFHKVVSPEDVYWEDEVEWDFAGNRAYVEARRPGLKSVRSETRVLFEPTETGTSYRVDGELRIDVPMFGPMLERFFVGHLESNTRRFYEILAEAAAAEPEPTPEAQPEPAEDRT